MRQRHRPNAAGLTIHQYISWLKPQGVPMAMIAYAYNECLSFDDALQVSKRYYPKRVKPVRRMKRIGLSIGQKMLRLAIEDKAAELYDRGMPELQAWLMRYLPAEKREGILQRLGKVVDVPD